MHYFNKNNFIRSFRIALYAKKYVWDFNYINLVEVILPYSILRPIFLNDRQTDERTVTKFIK